MKREDIEKQQKYGRKTKLPSQEKKEEQRHLRPEPTGASTACGMMQANVLKKKHANCLVEVKQGDFSFFLVSEFYQNGGFSFMNGICNLILKRWAYIKDLTPNTEE